MLVSDEPVIIDPLEAHGGTHPDHFVAPAPARAAVRVEHVREGHIPAHGDTQVVGLQPDVPLVLVKPPQEVSADIVGADEPVRGMMSKYTMSGE